MKERYRGSLGEGGGGGARARARALHPHNAIRRDTTLPRRSGNLLIVDQDYALEAAMLRGDNAPIGHTRRFRLRSCARARTCGRIPESSAPARAWRTWLFTIARIRYSLSLSLSLPPCPYRALATRDVALSARVNRCIFIGSRPYRKSDFYLALARELDEH